MMNQIDSNTDEKVTELIRSFNNEDNPQLKCFYLNDIGEIAAETDHKTAINFLKINANHEHARVGITARDHLKKISKQKTPSSE